LTGGLGADRNAYLWFVQVYIPGIDGRYKSEIVQLNASNLSQLITDLENGLEKAHSIRDIHFDYDFETEISSGMLKIKMYRFVDSVWKDTPIKFFVSYNGTGQFVELAYIERLITQLKLIPQYGEMMIKFAEYLNSKLG
jgi:hypothetical protein